jgi:hypothetical protein
VTRAAAWLAVAAGAALLVLPHLTWFTAPGPDGTVTASGTAASGGMWSVPVLGAAAALAGVAVLRDGGRRAPMGLAVAAAGLAALGWTLWVAAGVPVRLVTAVDGAARPVGEDPAPAWPAVAAPVAAAALVLAGVLLVLPEVRALRAARRRGGRP